MWNLSSNQFYSAYALEYESIKNPRACHMTRVSMVASCHISLQVVTTHHLELALTKSRLIMMLSKRRLLHSVSGV